MVSGAVTLQTYGKDMYKRTLADVLLPDGTHVNPVLVKDSWCWWYRNYAPGNITLEWLGWIIEMGQRVAKGTTH